MRRILLSTVLVAMGLIAFSVSAADYDLTGQWNFATSNNWKQGVCPAGKNSTGTCHITQDGDVFTLEILSGMVCNPVSMCTFTGTVSGTTYTCSNEATVDNEGGQVTNTITFTASSMIAASGSDSSTYVHPEMTCEWGFDIELSRDAEGISWDTDTETQDSGDSDADTDDTDDKDNEGGCGVVAHAPGNHLTLIRLLGTLFGADS